MSNKEEYQQADGTFYHLETPKRVVDVLESCRRSGRRIRLYYGKTDPDSPDVGLDWEEQFDITGKLGRSTGTIRIPILLHNSRSTGGGAILDHCIVRITSSRKGGLDLYRHPQYHTDAKKVEAFA
jgi:hypothetical protein